MSESDWLASVVLAKIEEQIDRTVRLISLIPTDKTEWRPQPNTFRVCDLLGHLLECLAGFCATLYAANTEQLAHFDRLRELPVNHCCGAEEALTRIADYSVYIREGFDLLDDSDLRRHVRTVFVAEGEPVLTLLLGNLEHLINHKYQLFFYLKLLGIPVSTSDLYLLKRE
jgi:hypothetical protein